VRKQTKVASTIVPGDTVVDGQHGVPATVLRGPYRSVKHSPGNVHFEVRTDDGRVWKARWADTDRVEVRP